MKRFSPQLRVSPKNLIVIIAAFAALMGLLLYKLGSLTGGLSQSEYATASRAVGFHGTYQQPLYLPLEITRSVVYALWPDHGQFLTRLPNIFFGVGAVVSFGWLIWLWHGRRTAIMGTVLFATSAWTLHVSRLASFDVLYLWAAPTLLLVQLLLQQARRLRHWYAGLFILGSLLYVPGFIWLLLATAWLQRAYFVRSWQSFKLWHQRLLASLCVLVWLPLLLINATRNGQLLTWLGLPHALPHLSQLGKNFIGVFTHIFIRGPQYPELWLGRLPLLDLFTLAASLVGIYFYATHWRSRRSRLLLTNFIVLTLLITLGATGPFSSLVTLLYMSAATGIAYLLHDWLKTFPHNVLARWTGIGLISAAIAISCVYNIRAYFIAWPHNNITEATFRYHR